MDNPTIPGAIRRLTLLVESGGILSPAEVADVRLVCKAAAMNNELVEALRALLAEYDAEIHSEWSGTSSLDEMLAKANPARAVLANVEAR